MEGCKKLKKIVSVGLVDVNRVDMGRLARLPAQARLLCDFLLFHENDPRKALELCTAIESPDWWWHARLGTCFLRLGLLRDAESRFETSLRAEFMISTVLALVQVYIRLDQPNRGAEVLKRGLEKAPEDPALLLALSRLSPDPGSLHRRAVAADPTCAEGLASLGAELYYAGHPEHALRLFRRLAQLGAGAGGPELWNNLGLCLHAAQQLDLVIPAFERALGLCTTRAQAGEVWYNIGLVALGAGATATATRAFRLAVTADPGHGGAHNNLAILHPKSAAGSLALARRTAPQQFEAFFNGACLALSIGDTEQCVALLGGCLAANPGFEEGKRMLKSVKEGLAVL
eukprot:TRINITY_DN1486_c0_g1_i1.p1 TRINITY_DN1486_c0_g1~~TRINITY_DN1486_c0_g1_i1.p1  ORF type:complete len:344 (+),score=13.63 TRINITY_DN1486_c0_g1_i1:207-1238(+)